MFRMKINSPVSAFHIKTLAAMQEESIEASTFVCMYHLIYGFTPITFNTPWLTTNYFSRLYHTFSKYGDPIPLAI